MSSAADRPPSTTESITAASYQPGRWTESLVRLLDDGLKLPFIKKGIGIDALIGLVLPVAGDTLTGLGSLALLGAALRARVPTVILGKMVLNIAVDVILGAIPILGDVFDIFWRSNRRNLDLIKEFGGQKKPAGAVDYLLVSAGAALAVLSVLVPLVLVGWWFKTLADLLSSF